MTTFMKAGEFVQDADDHVEGTEEDISVQVNPEIADVIGVVSINDEESINCDDGIITFEDGTHWYKVPVALVTADSGKEEDEVVESKVECWNNIEVPCNEENIVFSEEQVEEEAPVAGEVIVLDNGTIAYITSSTGENASEVKDETEKDTMVSKKRSKSYVCTEPGCHRSYSSLHHLKVHLRNHTGDRPFKCTMEGCDKAFATDYSRKAHLRTHTGEKPYPCTRCNKSFKTSGDLQKHIRTHTGERPFVCPVEGCNRSFTTSNIRKVHIRTHTGERPYICQFENCNRSFASSTNHKNHMRIHSGEKPFCCPVANCQKRFTEYSSLYKHQLVHSQIKRYKCPFCYKMYRQMSTLTTHKRTIHGVISADDGSEIILEQLIGNGKDVLKNFKNIAFNLLNLKKDRNTLISFDEEDPVYLVTEGQ